MNKLVLIIFILMFLFSCGKEGNNTYAINDSTETTLVDTFNTQTKNELDNDNNCGYDNQVSDLGIGLVISPSKFDVYNDSLLNNKYVSWDMYEHEDEINVCSKFYKPDYGIMHFVCVDTTDKAYKVLVNYSDFKYLPKTKSYEFKTWEEYILQSFGIRRLTVDTDSILVSNPLRVKPRDNSDTLIIPKGHEMFCPMEIKDDWIRVKYDCFYNDENNPNEGEPCYNFIDKCQNPLAGWLRWRNENKLLIDIFLIP